MVTGLALPVYLVGTLEVQIGESIRINSVQLGLILASYYVVTSVLSVPFGRLADNVGGLTVLRGAGWGCAVLMVVLAAGARSWLTLLLLLSCTAIASSAAQPAANLYLSQAVPVERQGFAFGIKQSSVPAAVTLGGLAVPAVALTVGWRWAFVGAGVMTAMSVVALPRSASYRQNTKSSRIDRQGMHFPLIVLAGAFGCGLAAASALAAFLVVGGTDVGLSKGQAGLLAAGCGGVCLAVRLFSGWLVDRWARAHFALVAVMLAVGVSGYAGLAIGTDARLRWLFVPAAVVAFGVGWGWNGVFNFGVVRAHSGAAAWATGVTQTGGRIGSAAGPIAFGALVDHVSFEAAWLAATGACVVAAVLMCVGWAALDLRSSRTPPAL